MRGCLLQNLLEGGLRVHSGATHHLDEDFLRILEPFEERWVFVLEVSVRNRHCLQLTLCIDESDDATAAAQDEL